MVLIFSVESQEVVHRYAEAADGWFGLQTTVRAMPVVVMKPDWQVLGALIRGVVGTSVMPFVCGRRAW
ncbi:hypothetical protein WN73_11720 [Bradyrhizobium sp. CCBAU 45394]|nr:hypothetical protein [Bradyrhizobium sp. CCBAU 45394]MDA9535818.1 hypothetical protein [Bradyrhizobium sp. CCBAU 21362]